MVEQTAHRSRDPDLERFESALTDIRAGSYKFGRSAKSQYVANDSVPLFLADSDGDPDPGEYDASLRRYRGSSVSLKILTAVVVAAGVAVTFAWYTSDPSHDVITDAKASIAAAVPPQPAAAQAEPAQLTASDVGLKEPAPASAPAQLAAGTPAPEQPQIQPQVQTPPPGPVMAYAPPTREEIATAYQSAIQSQAPAPRPPVTTPAVKQIDPAEFAALMTRAKDLLASGDFQPARLLLERAAEGADPAPALMLAQTYDPQVLGKPDVRNITADAAKARRWYERAAQLGSADAERRLAQLPN